MKTETKNSRWEIPGTDGGDFVICRRDKNGKRRTVAHAYDESEAILIARAPDLLAENKRLREILWAIHDLPCDDFGTREIPAGFLDEARAALADK